jgi:hypothetical protein
MLKTAASIVLACSEPRRTDQYASAHHDAAALLATVLSILPWLVKMAPNFVLGSHESSTYPEGTPAVLALPAASLDDHFDQPGSIDLKS